MRKLLFLLLGTTFMVSAQTTNKKQSIKFEDNPNVSEKEIFHFDVNENDTTLYKNHYLFERAIDGLENMLLGKEALNFKKAVFLNENAFYDGKLNWEEYNNEIQRIKLILNKIIIARNIQSHKTAGNFAIFSFMSDSIPENKYCPYKYDYDTFLKDGGEEAGMVTRLLKQKIGNCHSMPYLYKILANEMNVEACLALVPMHVYIKHRDEKGDWWNLEMTSGTFSRSSFLMESFNVSEQALKSGLFMKALSEEESIALCISDLLNIYESKTGIYSNDFVRKCYTIGIKYFPMSLLQSWKYGDIKYQLDKKMAALGMNNYQQVFGNPELEKLFYQADSTKKFIKNAGYTTLTNEQYREKATSILNHKAKK